VPGCSVFWLAGEVHGRAAQWMAWAGVGARGTCWGGLQGAWWLVAGGWWLVVQRCGNMEHGRMGAQHAGADHLLATVCRCWLLAAGCAAAGCAAAGCAAPTAHL
jgi:hypothetical protein